MEKGYVWDVVVAKNLTPGSRARQEYIWLEVTSLTQIEALAKAEDWALHNDLEPTDMIRRKTPHHGFAGNLANGRRAEILWHVPVISDMPYGMAVRDPRNGKRVGYLAYPEDTAKFNSNLDEEDLRLLVSRPAVGGVPIAVCPAVHSVELSFRANPIPGATVDS